MRAQRQQIKLLEDAGADEDDIINARCRYHGTSQDYTAFSKAMDLPQQRARVTADGLGNIGIGKTKTSSKLEEKSKKPITQITDTAVNKVPKVNISGYSDEQCEYIQKQHKELLEYSRQNNDNKEVSFVFDKDLGHRKEFIGEDDNLDFGNSLYGTNLFVMHNHPRNSSYSYTDLAEFIGNSSIKTLSIVKNNGSVEVLTKLCECDRLKLATDLERMKRNMLKTGSDAEYNRIVEKFLIKQRKNGVFEWLN